MRPAIEVEQGMLIRVLLADDHPIYRKVLEVIFEMECFIQVVGVANDGHQLLELVGRVEADVVILDVEMKPMDGLTALGFRVYALDARGYGATPRDDTGWSYGSMVGQLMAQRNPTGVKCCTP